MGRCPYQVADVPGVRWLHLDLGDPEMYFFGQDNRATAGSAAGLARAQ